ncbi:hypothetical protein Tco_1047016, partial [Tanacetum coccineum]
QQCCRYFDSVGSHGSPWMQKGISKNICDTSKLACRPNNHRFIIPFPNESDLTQLQLCIQPGVYLISGNAMHINSLGTIVFAQVSIHGIGVSVAEVVKVAGNVLATEDNRPAKNSSLRIKNQFNGYDRDLGYNGSDDFREGDPAYQKVAKEGYEATKVKASEDLENTKDVLL